MEKSKIVLKVVVLLVAIFLISSIVLLMTGGSNIYETILGLKKDEITPNNPTVSGETTNDNQTAESGENLENEDFKFYEVPDDKRIKSIMLEGMEEEVNYEYVESSLGYRFQLEKADFLISREDDKDYYRSKDLENDLYFTVEFKNINFEEEKEKQKQNIISDDDYTVNQNRAFCVDGKSPSSNDTLRFDSKFEDIIYVEAPNGVYIIKEYYFMEAIEGWASRVAQMLGLSFEIVD